MTTAKKSAKKGKPGAKEAKAIDERQELLEQAQRLQAEFENYKKRTEKEREEWGDLAQAGILQELLPVMDNLELALQNAQPEERDGFYKGVELIYAQLQEFLENRGVQIIDTSAFDPHKHEALLSEEAEGKAKRTILEVLQKGYELNGRVLRTAKVKVAK